MKVILTGATGYVGEGVLLGLLDDERIEKVLSVGRRPKAVLVLYPLLRLLGQICTMKEMVDAMYHVATEGHSKSNLEARDIIKCRR